MKTSPARIASVAVLAGALLLLWACYPAAEVSYSNPQDSVARQWLIEFRPSESRVELRMSYRRAGKNNGYSYNNTGFDVTLDQLAGLTREQVMSSSGTNVNFQLKRDAGTFIFEGWFKDGNGSGHFTFSPNPAFSAELSRQGFGRATDEELQSLAMSDTGLALVNELRSQGYDTSTVEQLVRMGNHGVRLEYLQELKSLGYSVKTTDLVVRMKDHGVSLNFIREMGGLGYNNLNPDVLIRMKDHGVSASFIKELQEAGFNNTSVEQLVRLKDHGVSASYIKRMKERGYADLSLDEYIRLKDRGERD